MGTETTRTINPSLHHCNLLKSNSKNIGTKLYALKFKIKLTRSKKLKRYFYQIKIANPYIFRQLIYRWKAVKMRKYSITLKNITSNVLALIYCSLSILLHIKMKMFMVLSNNLLILGPLGRHIGVLCPLSLPYRIL